MSCRVVSWFSAPKLDSFKKALSIPVGVEVPTFLFALRASASATVPRSDHRVKTRFWKELYILWTQGRCMTSLVQRHLRLLTGLQCVHFIRCRVDVEAFAQSLFRIKKVVAEYEVILTLERVNLHHTLCLPKNASH